MRRMVSQNASPAEHYSLYGQCLDESLFTAGYSLFNRSNRFFLVQIRSCNALSVWNPNSRFRCQSDDENSTTIFGVAT